MNEVGSLIDRLNRAIETITEARDTLQRFVEMQDRILRPAQTPPRLASPSSSRAFTTYSATSGSKPVDEESTS